MKNRIFITFALLAIIFTGLWTSCGPKRPSVAELREQKRLEDSTNLVLQQHSLQYADSMILVLQQQVEPVMKDFYYDKNDAYEDHGRYVHRSLKTAPNSSRCYIQAYVTDAYRVIVKGYYVGSYPLHISSLQLLTDSLSQSFNGSNHTFEAEGYHEIFTLTEEDAIAFLKLLDAYSYQKERIAFVGTKSNYRFLLPEKDKQALIETLLFATLMNDIHQLELQARQTSLHIEKYQKRLENAKIDEK